MILDTSAIVAVVMQEPGGRDARSLLTRLLNEASIAIVPFGEAHFSAAVEAWLRFGKGRHPAALNFGDCLSYAVAGLADAPLLCAGDDFARTDIA